MHKKKACQTARFFYAKKQKMECKNIFIIIQQIIYVSNSVILAIIFTQRNLPHHMKNVIQNAQVDIITLLKILINVLMDAQKLTLILLKIIILNLIKKINRK